mgnify:CR=1 FL=1
MNQGTDILAQPQVRESLEIYRSVTGLPAFAIDTAGQRIQLAGELPAYCALFGELTGESCPCEQAHLRAGKESERLGEAYIYFCPGGLVHWTAPVIAHGVLVGALVSGMVQMSINDPYVLSNLIKVYRLSPACKEQMNAHLSTIPVIDPGKVRHLAEMLNIVARSLSSDEGHVLDEHKRFHQEQRLIGENVHDIKKAVSPPPYPVDTERELINRVKRGDKAGAKALLNDILGYIFCEYAGSIEMMTVRGLELLVVISRAAIEGGADAQKIFKLNLEYALKMPKVNSVDRLSFLIINVLEQFTDAVFPVENAEDAAVIKTAISYINARYMERITLKEVADHVFLSPAYFSRIFKQKTGMNFCDYLNYVRVEESKKYLLDLEIPLSGIGPMVGFSDQSYFTKVFKKVARISPGQYRRAR